MIVQVVGGGAGALCVLELQGEVLGAGAGRTLGALTVSGAEAELRLDEQLLRGKVVALAKPLVVARREAGALRVLGVVRSKALFSARPEHAGNATKH